MPKHIKKSKPVNEETILTAKKKRKKRKGSDHERTLLTGG